MSASPASAADAPHTPPRNSPQKVAVASLIGTAIEFYDYYIYAADDIGGGSWDGNNYMCTRDETFTIKEGDAESFALGPLAQLRGGGDRGIVEAGVGGEGGGRLVAEGTPEDIAAVAESHTGRFLAPLLREVAVRITCSVSVSLVMGCLCRVMDRRECRFLRP